MLNPFENAPSVAGAREINMMPISQPVQLRTVIADDDPANFAAHHVGIVAGISGGEHRVQGQPPAKGQKTDGMSLGSTNGQYVQIARMREQHMGGDPLLVQALLQVWGQGEAEE